MTISIDNITVVYQPPAPELIIEPRSKSAMDTHQKYAFNNRTYFQQNVLGNDVRACNNYRECPSHDRHFHGVWNFHVDTYPAVYEVSSRGHIKTTWTQMVNAQDMIREPMITPDKSSFSNIEISYTSDQAGKWNTTLREIIEFASINLDLGLDFEVESELKTKLKGIMPNGAHNSSYSNGFGITGTIRMEHTKRVTIDDMINEDMNISIPKAERKFLGSIVGTRKPGTQFVYIGTVIEEDDPLDKIRNKDIGKGMFRGGEYTGIIEDDIPLLKDFYDRYLEHKISMMDSKEYYEIEEAYFQQLYEGNLEIPIGQNSIEYIQTLMTEQVMSRVDLQPPRVLWPEKRPFSYHIEQIDLQGWIVYQTEFLLRFTNQELALFKNSWIERAKEKGMKLILGREANGIVTMGDDFSISTSTSGDYNVFMILEHVDNHVIPLDMIRFRGADLRTDGKKGEVEDFIEWKLRETIDRYNPDEHVAEEVGFQRMFGNSLRHDGYDVVAYNTGSEKHSRIKGVPSLDKLFRDNRFIIPWGDDDTRKKMSIFIKELQGWQYVPDKKEYQSKAAHDDTTMALWMSMIAYETFNTSGFTFQGTMYNQ